MGKGIFYSVAASCVFGIMYFYAQFLKPLGADGTYAWRIITTVPLLTLFMYFLGDLRLIGEIWQRIRRNPPFFLLVLLSSFLGCFQLWLFLFAPMNGWGLEVSLGYFLLPLVLVLCGRLFFKEKLSGFQILASLSAAAGVGYALFQNGTAAWQTLAVAVGYAAYFVVRKLMKTNHLGGFWWDLALSLPYCFGVLLFTPPDIAYDFKMLAVIGGLGVLSTLGVGSYLLANRHLPMTVFGLLSYLEPVLLALVSLVFLGESVKPNELFTYTAIWLAIAVLVVEGLLHLKKRKTSGRLKTTV